jgi:hypothetical protein
MSIEQARYYENLRRSTYRNAKEAFSVGLVQLELFGDDGPREARIAL